MLRSEGTLSGCPRGRGRAALAGGQADGSRVLRGGSWNNNQNNARCAYRNNNHPDNRNNNTGFRLVVAHGCRDWPEVLPGPGWAAEAPCDGWRGLSPAGGP